MTLFEILPSLKAVTVNRTFDSNSWGPSVQAHRTDIKIGGRSVVQEFSRRKDAFYLDDKGLPTCQKLCPPDLVLPTLATRLITVATNPPEHLECRIAAHVPIAAAITDIAFPGTSLGGARLVDITLVDGAGHRRTIHAEAPPQIRSGSPILLALKPVTGQSPTTLGGPGIGSVPDRELASPLVGSSEGLAGGV